MKYDLIQGGCMMYDLIQGGCMMYELIQGGLHDLRFNVRVAVCFMT